MIRVLLVDDHPAMRAGLHTVLAVEPGLIPVGSVADEGELWEQLDKGRVDLVLLDYHLPGTDGLTICRRIKRRAKTQRVLLYSAYADASLAAPAILAGADGMAHKGLPARELYDVVRRVGRGERVMPALSAGMRQAAAGKLDIEDQPILSMAIDGTPTTEIAEVMRTSAEALEHRIQRMLALLSSDLPS